MKTCSACKIEKPLEEFSKRGRHSNGEIKYQSKCKDCNKKYQREHYSRNKKDYATKARDWERKYKTEAYHYLMDYAKDGCVKCGEKHFACLQFNHIDPEQKSFGISQAIGENKKFDLIKEELRKCEILCANCHAKHTAKQQGWYKLY